MSRQELEASARSGAGIIDETNDYYLVRVLDSFEMYVHKGDQSVTPHLVRDGFWESWVTQYIASRIHAGTVFFDVGANTGYYSFLANYMGAMVASFEPNPEYYQMIQATIQHQNVNRMPIRVSNTAISDKSGTQTLYVPKNLHGSASLSEMDAKWEVTPVEVKTETLGLNGCGHYMIKIDAEGHEEQVWDGMIESLSKRAGPSEVILEYTPGAYSENFLDKLEAYAPLRRIDYDGQPEPVSREWLKEQTDWVMLVLK